MSEERPTAVCCPDWEEHVSTIDDVLQLHQVRSGEALDFEPFRFCPYCGSAREEAISMEQIEMMKRKVAETIARRLTSIPKEKGQETARRAARNCGPELGGLLEEIVLQPGRSTLDLTELEAYPLEKLVRVADWTQGDECGHDWVMQESGDETEWICTVCDKRTRMRPGQKPSKP